MAEKLSIQIALEGGKEIERQLADIGDAGQKAFGEIGKAAEDVGGFKNLKPEQVTAALKAMGVEGVDAVNKIQGAVAQAGRLERVAGAVATVERAFGRMGTVGATVLGELGAAAGKLGANLTRSLGPLAGAARALGPVGIAAGAVGAGSVALVKFAEAAEQTAKALTQLQSVSKQSFADLSAMATVFREGGTPIKQFAGEFGNLSEKIGAALEAWRVRQADEDTVQWANDIRMVRQQFDNLANGASVTFSSVTKLNTKVQALLESLAKVAPGDRLFKLADIFKNLSSDAERAQIGKALGLSPETIQRLTLGSAKLKQMAEEAKKLGMVLDAVDKKNLSTMIQSQHEAGALFDALKDKIGALAAPAVSSFWKGFTDQIKQLMPEFTQMGQVLGNLDLSSIGAALANIIAFLAKIAIGWVILINLISQAIGAIGRFAAAIVQFVTTAPANAWQWIVDTAMNAWGQVTQLAQQAMAAIVQFVTTAPANAWQWIADTAVNVWAQVQQLGQQAIDAVVAFVTTAPANAWKWIVDTFNSAMEALGQAIDKQIQKLRQLLGLGNQVAPVGGAAAGGLVAFARGGKVGGRGTGTSDSNLAWVSRGEHIMPARAVAQPGVLAFLEALRRSGGNLSRVLDGMGRFALGGLVPRSVPAFAGSGPVGGMSNVTIQFPGLQPISGLRASAEVVDELRKAAAMAQVRSGGRKPSRYS